MKISILLPYKENFSSEYAGAVSLQLKDTTNLSRFKKNIKIFGSTTFKQNILKKNYVNLSISKFFFQSRSKIYIKNFLNYEKKEFSDLIEIHNRPNYIRYIYETNNNIVLYFHNNPLDIKGSKTIRERNDLLKKVKKIIFISNWTKNQFLKGVNKLIIKNKQLEVITHSTNKKFISFKSKKKIILFVGRLNKSKGYDVFGSSITKLLDKFPSWRAIVIGDEPREKYVFIHKNLKILGFQKQNVVSKYFRDADISVVCSRWNEPFGRTALEASSSGCAVIITNRGGLPEASPHAIKINNLNSHNLKSTITKIITNEKFKKNLQKRIYNNFKLTNELIAKKIDKYRIKLIKY
tara:strand:+ start:97 stop:1146 length:1050 start_codon:yes stop_codon:yes gene_type:complete